MLCFVARLRARGEMRRRVADSAEAAAELPRVMALWAVRAIDAAAGRHSARHGGCGSRRCGGGRGLLRSGWHDLGFASCAHPRY